MTAVGRTVVLLAATLTGVLVLAAPAHAGAGSPPDSMASLGDSISRGYNACCFYVDCASRWFSSGDDSGVNSQYLRIRAVNPASTGTTTTTPEAAPPPSTSPVRPQRRCPNRSGT